MLAQRSSLTFSPRIFPSGCYLSLLVWHPWWYTTWSFTSYSKYFSFFLQTFLFLFQPHEWHFWEHQSPVLFLLPTSQKRPKSALLCWPLNKFFNCLGDILLLSLKCKMNSKHAPLCSHFPGFLSQLEHLPAISSSLRLPGNFDLAHSQPLRPTVLSSHITSQKILWYQLFTLHFHSYHVMGASPHRHWYVKSVL